MSLVFLILWVLLNFKLFCRLLSLAYYALHGVKSSIHCFICLKQCEEVIENKVVEFLPQSKANQPFDKTWSLANLKGEEQINDGGYWYSSDLIPV